VPGTMPVQRLPTCDEIQVNIFCIVTKTKHFLAILVRAQNLAEESEEGTQICWHQVKME
jgi:hypothetical protein